MTLVNLYSDTQTRPSPAMRKAMAEAEVGDEQRFEDPQVTALCSRVAALLGIRGGGLPPLRHDVQRDRVPAAHPARRRRGDPAPDLAPDHRRGRRAGGVRGRDDAAAGHAARACSPATTCAARCATRTATRRARGWCRVEQTTNMAGGRVWPLAQLRGVVEVAQRARAAAAHGRRAADERGRRLRRPGAEMTRRVRHRVAGLHEGPRRAAGRVPGRLGRADRRGVALQADARRRAAPGGDRRRGRAVRARPQRRAAGRRPRERARAGARASRRSTA